eukprot:1134447-Pyramimonas_sp.AAC.1
MLTGVEHGGPDCGFIRRCSRGLPFFHVVVLIVVFLEVGIRHSDSLGDESGSFVGTDGRAVQKAADKPLVLTPGAHRGGKVSGVVWVSSLFPSKGSSGAPAPHVLGGGFTQAAERAGSIESLPDRNADAAELLFSLCSKWTQVLG